MPWVGKLYLAIMLWIVIITVVVICRGKEMPHGTSIGILFGAALLGLLTVLLSGCEPYEYEIAPAGPPPVFDWKASAAVDAYRAPEVRITE